MNLPTFALLLARLGRLNESFVHDVCRIHDTTPAEFRVLALLRHGDDGGPVSPTTISNFIVQTSGGLTATLRRVEAAGYIERRPDPSDGRGRLVALTETGAAFHDKVFADLLDRYELVVGAVDVDAALATVRALVQAFERHSNLGSSAGWSSTQPSPADGAP